MAHLMPLPLTVSCFSEIQVGFTFLVPAHLGSPGKRAVKRVCVCVCCPYHTAATRIDTAAILAYDSFFILNVTVDCSLLWIISFSAIAPLAKISFLSPKNLVFNFHLLKSCLAHVQLVLWLENP